MIIILDALSSENVQGILLKEIQYHIQIFMGKGVCRGGGGVVEVIKCATVMTPISN